MNAILDGSGSMVDDVYHYNLLCCLDECDKRCSLIHEFWLSPWTKKPGTQLAIEFMED